MPEVFMKIWSAAPFSTTFVSPVTIETLGVASGFGSAFDNFFEHLKFKAFLDDKAETQCKRPCAGNGQIIDRAADGEFADIAAVEKQRLYNIAVGCKADRRGWQIERG